MALFFLKNCILIAPASVLNGKRVNMLFDERNVIAIGEDVAQNDAVLVSENAYFSDGWVDMWANFCEPGNEPNETLLSGANAAAAGGYTHVCVVPNTQPVLDNKSQVEYVMSKSKLSPVRLLPIAALTKGCDGKLLTEMYDLHSAGVGVFADGYQSVQNAGDLSRMMQYVKPFGGLIMNQPNDLSMALDGQVNESETTVMSGLRSAADLAETLMLRRDIELAKYNDAALHVPIISCKSSVELIRNAKLDGVKVSCGTAIHHLLFTDDNVLSYDSVYKVQPPFRTDTDRQALIDAVIDSTIDVVCSNHRPCRLEDKQVEFEYAAYGQASIQTSYMAYLKVCNDQAAWVRAVATKPRQLLQLNTMQWVAGETLDMTVFTPEGTAHFDANSNLSKSINHPLLGETLQGTIIKTIKPVE
jgi:dihydroorotase